MTGLRGIRAGWAAASLAIAIFIFAQSSRPSPSVGGGAFNDVLHLLAHLLLYAALAGCSFLAIRQASGRAIWLVAIAVFLYGVSDELHQALVPSRDATLGDVLVDLAGAVLGAHAGWLLERSSLLKSRTQKGSCAAGSLSKDRCA
jgi:VanZ family protein